LPEFRAVAAILIPSLLPVKRVQPAQPVESAQPVLRNLLAVLPRKRVPVPVAARAPKRVLAAKALAVPAEIAPAVPVAIAAVTLPALAARAVQRIPELRLGAT